MGAAPAPARRLVRPETLFPPGLPEALALAGLADAPWAEVPPSPDGGTLYLIEADRAWALEAVLWDAAAPAAVVGMGGPVAGLAVPCFFVPEGAGTAALAEVLRAANAVVEARARASQLALRLAESEERIAALNRIGIALSAERDLDRLLERILTESRRFSNSEAGSLYLLEEGSEGRQLRFKLAQNDAVRFAFTERTMPVDDRSLSGFVANHGEPLVLDDAYLIPDTAPYRHNDAFDVATGWRTRAVLVVPMKDHRGELVGVLQLMNRRAAWPGAYEPYPPDLVSLVQSLATQAAVCLKANALTASIRKLFEDFARAAIFAVEQRDPTTAGHSNRVASLTVALARIVDRAEQGPYAAVRFSREELREIDTAALLHDFGKVSIPERVLVKAKKVEEESLRRIRDRFDFALESGDHVDARQLLDALARAGAAPGTEDLRALDRRRAERAVEMERFWEEVLKANEPSILHEETGARLRALLARTFRDRRGGETTLLHDGEFALLSIPKGSLSVEERTQIESHVSHTWRFLSTIPWTADLARVPDIAYSHHEKLNGGGYPRRLDRDDIPVQARMLTVCDIYDALTASDRPYKKAVPADRALRILEDEARSGSLDSWIVQTFVEEKVWLPTGS